MMISAFDVYLINQIDNLKIIFLIMLILGGWIGLSLIKVAFDLEGSFQELKKTIITMMILFFIGLFGFLLTPDTKTLYQMYIIPKFANSEFAKQLPDYLNQYIKNELINKGKEISHG